jgi:hypothetical protein
MRNNVNSIWTEEVTATLKRLWSEGYSCSQIAGEMGAGITRNAVIGKAHRLELPSRSNNVNGQCRAVNPKPQGEPRRPPAPGSRPRTCRTVFQSREIKPANPIINKPATPGLMTVMSNLTGYPISIYGRRQPRLARQMTKNELRDMLATAVQNTAAMEAP